MISHELIVTEIDKYLLQAKHAQNEQEIREALSAVRALCDVVLAKSSETIARPSRPLDMQTSQVIQSQNIQPSQQMMQTQIPASITTNKLHEEDANGDSIFDF
ncbi:MULTISPECIES: YwdI family protein [unclassified Viridibacillus]|uniref:YwdI family protein n=1 Tax=unclassified Viridibacillus TaxID=2617942 RepID=UPI0030F7DABA